MDHGSLDRVERLAHEMDCARGLRKSYLYTEMYRLGMYRRGRARSSFELA